MLTGLFDGIGNVALYGFAFLSVLTVVVFIHELGHFLVARWCGVRVTTFSIGFGREIWGFHDRQGTRWRLAWIPLGGYVKFMDDENAASVPSRDAAAALTPEERAGAFHAKPIWKRAAVVAAGPLANFLLAIAVFAVSFMLFGVRSTAPRVDEVIVGSPAAVAGFQPGDVIVSIDGRAIRSFNDVLRTVTTGGGRPLAVVVTRKGQAVDLKVTPQLDEAKDDLGGTQSVWRVGIRQRSTPDQVTEERVGPVTAIGLGIKETTFIITSTLSYLGDVVTLRQRPDQLGGPVRIADVAGKVAQRSVLDLVYLAAFISVSVGLVNLFPIPLLDGGHLMFYAIEAVRGRPLSERSQELSFRIGMAVLLTIMMFSMFNDLPILKKWLTGVG
ncbi:MAG: RIP metalloprotease RseP [Hyphomicrobiaceae bacterium]